jgi:hypothetical protein
VALCDGTAKEGNRSSALVKNCTEPRTRSITLDDKGCCKIRKLEHGRCHQCHLEVGKSLVGLCRPREPILAEKTSQWCCNGAVVLDKAVVVTCETQRNPRRARTMCGVGQSVTPSTLEVSMATPSAVITWPRYETHVSLKKHLGRLRKSWCWWRRRNTVRM